MNQQMYSYKVYKDVYEEIISGKKTVEFRLLNDKSERIKKDDLIKFSVMDDESRSIIVRVTDKYIYDNVDALWQNKTVLADNILNLSKEEFIKMLNEIFGKENVQHSKIVGIKFTL